MFFSAGLSASATTAGATAVEIPIDMGPRRQWRLTAKGSLWFRIVQTGASGTNAAQVAGASSHYLSDGRTFEVAAVGPANRISIIRDGGTDVTACLSEIPTVQPL